MARDVDATTNEPINPTTTFQASLTIHAVVALQNAPANTRVKAAWYATDVGSVAPCNTFVNSAELTELEGSLKIDFRLSPTNPVGSYRVEIFVNGNLDQVITFNIR
jgi:hypothetical protein